MSAGRESLLVKALANATGLIELVVGTLLLLAVAIALNLMEELTPLMWVIVAGCALYGVALIVAGIFAFARPGRFPALHIAVGAVAIGLFVFIVSGERSQAASARAVFVLAMALASGTAIVCLTLVGWLKNRRNSWRVQSEGST